MYVLNLICLCPKPGVSFDDIAKISTEIVDSLVEMCDEASDHATTTTVTMLNCMFVPSLI